jgi:hypothetical protein
VHGGTAGPPRGEKGVQYAAVRTGDRWVRNWDGGGEFFTLLDRADQGGSNDPKFMAVAWLLAVWQSFERGPVIFFLNFFFGCVGRLVVL